MIKCALEGIQHVALVKVGELKYQSLELEFSEYRRRIRTVAKGKVVASV